MSHTATIASIEAYNELFLQAALDYWRAVYFPALHFAKYL